METGRLVRALLGRIARRVGAGTALRLYAISDQGLTGLGNIIAFALLGRVLPVVQFGIVGSTIGLHYLIAGFHRSAVVLPFTTDHRADRHGAAGSPEDSGWWWLGLALACLLAALSGLAGIGVALAGRDRPDWAWMAEPLLLTALISPAMLGWEFARRWLYKIERADLVSLCSLAYFLLLVAATWEISRRPSAVGAVCAWIVASLGALAVALPALRPGGWDRGVAARLVRANRADAAWLAATNLPYSVYSSATIVVPIGILVGPAAAGLFSAARTLTNPAISIVSAIDSIDKPRAARAFAGGGVPRLAELVRRSRHMIALATGLYLGGVCLFAQPLIRFAFHDRYAGLEGEVRLLALGFFLFGLNLPSETTLIVLRAGRTMLAVRTITAVATIVTLAIGTPWGMTGMVLGFALTQGLNFLLLRGVERQIGARVARIGPA